ncbi:MAG TPA: hypothetical protein VGV92_01985 [Gammaproteobacteria bacterium]|nr:hypothetical protein [Gammaproteobacteria bacterium]
MTSIKKLTLFIVLLGFIFSYISSQQEAIELSTKTPAFFESHESEHSFKRFDIHYPIRPRRPQIEIREK